jgi:RNA polymerase sigma-70 factor (ECF subfamily)
MPDIEKNIFKKIKVDDIKSFEFLFRKYYTLLCNYAFKILKNIDASEEIVQDLFFNIWEKRHSITIESSVKSYLYKSTYNRSMLFLRHKSVKTRYEKYLRDHDSQTGSDASVGIDVEELAGVIDRTLEELPERSRKIFILSRFEGLKYHEIAKKLSLSVKTIESNMGKALKLFRKNIKTYLETT